MRPWQVYMHLSLLDSVPGRGVQRRQIMDFISNLRDHPETQGDYTDKDASLRERQVKIVGKCAVTYWLDDPIQTVMVVDVKPADR